MAGGWSLGATLVECGGGWQMLILAETAASGSWGYVVPVGPLLGVVWWKPLWVRMPVLPEVSYWFWWGRSHFGEIPVLVGPRGSQGGMMMLRR